MKNAFEYWLKVLIFDIVFWAIFVAWQGFGIEGAHNAFVFIGWFFGVMCLLAGASADKTSFDPEPAGARTYQLLSTLLEAVAMAWVGHLWMGAVWMLAGLMVASARQREPKEKTS